VIDPLDPELDLERPFVVELMTTDGRVSERFATLDEALRRVDEFPAAALIGLPLVLRKLPDGSERLVREDGKPLQFHRILAEDFAGADQEPLPLVEGESGLIDDEGKLKLVEPRPPVEDDGEWGEDIPFDWPEK
jgi:hypothetical protein